MVCAEPSCTVPGCRWLPALVVPQVVDDHKPEISKRTHEVVLKALYLSSRAIMALRSDGKVPAHRNDRQRRGLSYLLWEHGFAVHIEISVLTNGIDFWCGQNSDI